MKKHYHVLIGLTGGYMPDDNVVCATRREAQRTAAEYKRMFNDTVWQCEDEDERRAKSYTGSLYRDGYAETGDGNDCIEITECYEADCLDDSDCND
jgi:hypothetical protein